MVQVFESKNHKGRMAEMLGMSLGQGLGTGINTYFANKALDDVINDKSNANKPISAKMGLLQSALSPYGEQGQQLLQQRMQIEQQADTEEREKKSLDLNKRKSKAAQKILNNEKLSEGEDELFSPQEWAGLHKARQVKETKKTQASQPIDPEQLQKIKSVRQQPGFDELDELGQYRAFTDANVSKENAAEEAKLRNQQLTRQNQEFEKSYAAQKSFIDDTTSSYKGFETEMKPRLLQMQNIKDEDLIGPTAAVFLESLGIPLGALEDPSSELYNKLSQDLLKGLPETYGSRILKVEVENFLKTIPTLMNSADGRRMIASNMLKLGEMKEVYYNEMRKEQKNALDTNKPLPKDFQQRIFDQVKPQIDKLNNEFIKLSEIKSVPKNTIPFFSPQGEVEFVPKEHAQWASENGGRRIW